MKRKNKLSDKQFAEATEAMNHQNNQKSTNNNGVIWGGNGGISMQSVLGGQFKSVMGESVGINPKEAGPMRGPAPSVVMNDHENLQVSK